MLVKNPWDWLMYATLSSLEERLDSIVVFMCSEEQYPMLMKDIFLAWDAHFSQ